jgi:hypothetical protein
MIKRKTLSINPIYGLVKTTAALILKVNIIILILGKYNKPSDEKKDNSRDPMPINRREQKISPRSKRMTLIDNSIDLYNSYRSRRGNFLKNI